MNYKIVKGNHKERGSYGKYVARAMHLRTFTAEELQAEIQANCSAKASDVVLVLRELKDVLMQHLKDGDKVELPFLGTLKLELESASVDSPEEFDPRKHIKRAKLHFLPSAKNKKRELYDGIKYHRIIPSSPQDEE